MNDELQLLLAGNDELPESSIEDIEALLAPSPRTARKSGEPALQRSSFKPSRAGLQDLDVRVQQIVTNTTPYLTDDTTTQTTPLMEVYMETQESSLPSKPMANISVAGSSDPYVGRDVIMVAGKYKNRKAHVECKLTKKYRVHIEGLGRVLEFYPTQFALPEQLSYGSKTITLVPQNLQQNVGSVL